MQQMTLEETTELETIVETIKNTVKTKEIYLFGSYARGEQREYSDFDVYVVLDDEEPRKPIECEQEIGYACRKIVTKGMDVLTEFSKNFQISNSGIEGIVKKEGVMLYG